MITSKMKVNVSITFAIIITTIFFMSISICASETGTVINTKSKKIVAKVNGEPIYEDALIPYVQRELKKFKKFSGKRDTSALEKRMQMRALNEVISLELIKQESKKIQLENIEIKIDGKLMEMKKKYQNQEKFEHFLSTKGLTEDDVKESIKANIYMEQYLKAKGVLNPQVPEDDIKKYYRKSKASFQADESIWASHILIMVKEDAKPDEKLQAKEKAKRIRKEIIDGGNFNEMAKKHSEDARASQGGDLGYINKRYMPPEFDKVAFSLNTGELSEVVETKHGYHIIKVVDKKPAGVVPYEEVRDFIGKYLQEGLSREKRALLLKELRGKAKIDILLNES